MLLKIFMSLLLLNFIVTVDTSPTAGQALHSGVKTAPEKKLTKSIDSAQAQNEKIIALAREERENDKATIAALAKSNREQALLIASLKKGLNKFELKISAGKMDADTVFMPPKIIYVHDTVSVHDTTEVSHNLLGKKKYKKLQ